MREEGIDDPVVVCYTNVRQKVRYAGNRIRSDVGKTAVSGGRMAYRSLRNGNDCFVLIIYQCSGGQSYKCKKDLQCHSNLLFLSRVSPCWLFDPLPKQFEKMPKVVRDVMREAKIRVADILRIFGKQDDEKTCLERCLGKLHLELENMSSKKINK